MYSAPFFNYPVQLYINNSGFGVIFAKEAMMAHSRWTSSYTIDYDHEYRSHCHSVGVAAIFW